MPTIISHPAVALLNTFSRRLPKGAVAAGAIASVLPDGDAMTFSYGIPYGSTFGHRGFSHSIVFALLVSVIATALLRPRGKVAPTFAFIFVCAMSHPLLDACTNGGLGIAFFSPFSNRRYFSPWRPIEVSPIAEFDAGVLKSEIAWVWLPFIVISSIGALSRWRERVARRAG